MRSFFIFATDSAISGFAAWAHTADATHLRAVADAAVWLEARDKRLNISLQYGWLAEMLTSAGRHDEARSYAARAFSRNRQHDRLGMAMANRALARASAKHEWPRSATHYLDLAFASARMRDSRHEKAATELCAAELALARGARGEATRQLDTADPAFEAMRMPAHLARARCLRATL